MRKPWIQFFPHLAFPTDQEDIALSVVGWHFFHNAICPYSLHGVLLVLGTTVPFFKDSVCVSLKGLKS